jgi:DNA modification methylase
VKPYTLHTGDCLQVLSTLADNSIQCCVTSPPYWGLRDYGLPPTVWPEVSYSPMAGLPPITVQAMSCCLGHEPTPESFIAHLVLLFREVRRVLRPDGTLWLNLGDSYASSGGAGIQGKTEAMANRSIRIARESGRHRDARRRPAANGRGEPQCAPAGTAIPDVQPNRLPLPGLKPKDLIGIPWRAFFALQADGWYGRQGIIWAKENPMPESVRDRCTKSYEDIFLMAKSKRYFFDHVAIKEPAVKPSGSGNKERKPGSARGCPARSGSNVCGSVPWGGTTRSKRNVWRVSTKPYKGAHFAVFPPDLIEPCVLAGSRPGSTVLDLFNGSGTTGAVAVQHRRLYVGIDLNPDYIELAIGRIEAALAPAKPKRPRRPRTPIDAQPELFV